MHDKKNNANEEKTSVIVDVDPNVEQVEKIDREMICCNILCFFFPKMFSYDCNDCCYCF